MRQTRATLHRHLCCISSFLGLLLLRLRRPPQPTHESALPMCPPILPPSDSLLSRLLLQLTFVPRLRVAPHLLRVRLGCRGRGIPSGLFWSRGETVCRGRGLKGALVDDGRTTDGRTVLLRCAPLAERDAISERPSPGRGWSRLVRERTVG